MTEPSDDVIDILLAWEEQRRTTPNLTLDKLCATRPDLLPEVQRHAATLQSVDAILGDHTPPRAPSPRFRLEQLLGAGGMGDVYRAYDHELDRLVAIKFPRRSCAALPAYRIRFRREGQTLAKLNHPHIVVVHEAGIANAEPYLVMEYLAGGSLAAYKPTASPTPAFVRWVVGLLVQVADAVACAHRAGILHRDLKPSNILLDAAGQPKVADFGVAALFSGEAIQSSSDETPHPHAQHTRLTGYGRAAGTLAYTAPELRRGDAHTFAPTADLWSLGVVLHEMVTGYLPPQAYPLPDQDHAPCAPALPSGLGSIIARCLASDPRQRYANAEELATTLRGWLRQQDRRRFVRRRVAPALVMCLVVAMLIAAYWPASAETQRQRRQQQLQTQLEQGAVRLIGATGAPKGHRIIAGHADTTMGVTADGYFKVGGGRHTMVELVERVPTDSFEFTGEIRQESVLGPARVGLYVAHRTLDGETCQLQSSCCITFADIGPSARDYEPVGQPAKSSLRVDWMLFPSIVVSEHDVWSLSARNMPHSPPAPAHDMVIPWRRVHVVVTPQGIEAYFDGQIIEGTLSISAIESAKNYQQLRWQNVPAEQFGVNLKGSVGLYLLNCEAAFRNVELIQKRP